MTPRLLAALSGNKRMGSEQIRMIFSLGTSNRSLQEFIELLKNYGLEVVVDVRRFPSSQFEHFKRENLARFLKSEGIAYIYLGEELGGYRREGYQNFTASSEFKVGLSRLEEIAREKKTVFICAERFAWRCHRRFIAQELEKRGWQVRHIIDREREWIPKILSEKKGNGEKGG